MSVYIQGMEMPKEATVIAIYKLNGKFYASAHGTELCPIVSVPQHGRLIDADDFLSQYKGNIWTAQTDYAEGLRDVANDIKQAPTIIEAEED